MLPSALTRLFSAPALPAGLQPLLVTELFLPTGRLIACDPVAFSQPQPFRQTCPPGYYPVYVHVMPEEDRIAYAEMRLREAPVSRWELAVTAQQDPASLGSDELFGYPVSAGLGCFMDYATLAQIDQHDADLQAELGDEYISYYDDYVDGLLYSADGSHQHYVLQPYPDKENNVAVFQSGYGDGVYATYVGLDDQNQPVKFVTEFIDADNA
ncbi:DUF4241 domain-containing protein [Hymenobacter taeanensis]|uniref:DUF4241 domain-containing protein n=1 Tax=Hymenobacter taeanensis TaxID=2735321 RepID=A0A6M6BM43_9BACT|nr:MULTISPECIES: DUF4241 domain-containing protein [Hymenobacter]QJX49047.1 DUF4241 domain-containing protein [Hymenobacter taeanensis]UOQ81434.1 DUF4241 domain-containing protein [Hymenobacter sp. 5414T-23]